MTATTATAPAKEAPQWIEEPVLAAQREAFYAAQPQTRITPEFFASLEREFDSHTKRVLGRRKYKHLAEDSEWEETRQAIIARVYECATSYRIDPGSGARVYDYLQQKPGYVVWHASGKVYSDIRRKRREAERTCSLLASGLETESDAADRGNGEHIDPDADERLADTPEFDELVDAILERLEPAQREVFRLMVGKELDTPAVGRELGLDRRRVHERMKKIREATLAVLSIGDLPLPEVASRYLARAA